MSGIMQSFMGSFPVAAAGGGGTQMRALLSASGQTTYDATSNNSWFNVTAADYAAVFTGLAGTTKIGMSDAQVTVAGPSAFVGTYGASLPQSYATVPATNYIIGFVTRSYTSTAATIRPYVSTTFKGTYTTLGANIITTPATTNPIYYLRKVPSSAQGSTSYVALGPRNAGSGNWAATGSWPTNGAYSADMTSWTNYSGVLPIQQWLISTTNP